jgi:hypothetical protein
MRESSYTRQELQGAAPLEPRRRAERGSDGASPYPEPRPIRANLSGSSGSVPALQVLKGAQTETVRLHLVGLDFFNPFAEMVNLVPGADNQQPIPNL